MLIDFIKKVRFQQTHVGNATISSNQCRAMCEMLGEMSGPLPDASLSFHVLFLGPSYHYLLGGISDLTERRLLRMLPDKTSKIYSYYGSGSQSPSHAKRFTNPA